jgi:ABC-type Zn uptake system ZnuABC Zn-binding protein ZnuA
MGATNLRSLRCAIAAAAVVALAAAACGPAPERAAARQRIVCTTFPVYQIARNIAEGAAGVRVDILLPPGLGCPHDYALTPQDMRSIAQADVLVVNGLGLETFLGEPIRQANPKAPVIDATRGIGGLIPLAEEPAAVAPPAQASGGEPAAVRDRRESASGFNPHLFADPRTAALMTRNIAAALSETDPRNAAIYRRNGEAYAAKLDGLARDFAALGKRLRNRKVVTEHAVFDYLARDVALEIVDVVEEMPGQEPSAAHVLEIVQRIRTSGAVALFVEPQYSAKVSRIIAREAGVPVATLDPAATGPEDAPLGYYESVMSRNMATLERTLGAAPK